MTTHRDAPTNKAFGPPHRLLLGLTGALLALLILNLAVFDDLRIDSSAGVLDTFGKPQHLASLVAVPRTDSSAAVLDPFAKPQHLASLVALVIAGVLLVFKPRSAGRVAAVV